MSFAAHPAEFAVRDALAAGISAGRLRNRRLSAPFHGVRVAAGRQSDIDARCRALLTRFPDDVCISNPTVALLWDLPLPPSGTRTTCT